MDLALLLQEASLDGRVYTNQLNYTADGRLNTRTSPGGRYMWYQPDGHGRPQQLNSGGIQWAHSAVYHPSGQLTAVNYGNGTAYTASFNARQQMTSLRVAAGSNSRLHYSYGRDVLGRVTSIDDHVDALEDRSFGYDALGRLISAAGPWGSGSFSYDLLNNIRSKTLGARTVELQYNAAGRLNRYRDTAAGNVWRNQAYDARGNTTNDGLHGFVYDRSERPVSISGGAGGSFVYDAHGRRVRQTLNGETIYTVYGLDGTLLFRDNATTGEETDYIAMGSHTVGRFDEAGVFTWTHSDHLGSASAATNASGAVAWRESYTPFGEVLNNPAANRNEAGFTGHIRDHATGLTYAQARYYNPVTARFLAPDPVGFASGGPGYFNRYAYVMNDPVNATDPTGMHAANPAMRAAFQRAGVRAGAGLIITQADSPVPGPADIVGVGVIVVAGGLLIYDVGSVIVTSNGRGDPYTTPGGREVAHGARSGEYLGEKGWTGEEADGVIDNPAEVYENRRPNNTSGLRQRTYTDSEGNWVVVDEQGRITQANDRNNPRQERPQRDEPEQKIERDP